MNDMDPEDSLRSTWSIGRLRPWLNLIAARELPDALRGRVEPSDIVQQTLLKAWRGEAGFQGSTHAERLAWLRAILKNTIRDQHRRVAGAAKRGQLKEQNIADVEHLEDVGIEACAVAADPTVSAQLIRAEETLELAGAIEALPEDQRQVMLMRHIDGRSHREIAESMSRSVPAVRMLWVRALCNLSQQLGEDYSGTA